MAPSGLYDAFVDVADVVSDGDRVEVIGARFGPAGIAAVELDDASTWEVDHAEPSQLVALDVDGADPASAPLLIAALGADEAMHVADRARDPRRHPSDPSADPTVGLHGLWSRRVPSDAAVRAGRLVLLADVAQDPTVDPLARILAVVELVAGADATAEGALFAALRSPLVDLADSLAADTDVVADIRSGIVGFDARRRDRNRTRLGSAIEGFGSAVGDVPPGLGRLLDALVAAAGDTRSDLDTALTSAAALEDRGSDPTPPAHSTVTVDPAATPDRVEFELAAGPVEGERADVVRVDRLSPELVEVSVARSEVDRWVRVLRRDGLVLLSQAPLRPEGLMDRGELLVPPDTTTDEIEVHVVDTDALGDLGDQPARHIRDAIRAGRAAASAQRRRDLDLASRRWNDCAASWQRAGDRERAALARQRLHAGSAGLFRGGALLADDLDPYRPMRP